MQTGLNLSFYCLLETKLDFSGQGPYLYVNQFQAFINKVGRSKPPPVLTSGFNRLKPPWSISEKVVNTGQYESKWSIENLKGHFCGGLRYLYKFYVLSIEK